MERRWAAHVREARSPKWSVNTFANAIRRFGPKAFTHEELEVCFSQWDANKAEVRWVEKFNTTDPLLGFNTQRGGTRAVRRSRAKPPTRPVDVERPESARPATTSCSDANDVVATDDAGYVILDGGQPVCLDDVLVGRLPPAFDSTEATTSPRRHALATRGKGGRVTTERPEPPNSSTPSPPGHDPHSNLGVSAIDAKSRLNHWPQHELKLEIGALREHVRRRVIHPAIPRR